MSEGMTAAEIKARVDEDERENGQFLAHFAADTQRNINWRPSIGKPTIVTYPNILALLAEIARLGKRHAELELLVGKLLNAYSEWAKTADVVNEDFTALNTLEEYVDLLKSFLGIVDAPNEDNGE